MRTHGQTFWTIAISLIFLRVIIGLHFFSEGLTKIQSGSFSCAGFLGQAKGPFASSFQSLVDDFDGRIRLCIDESDQIDTRQTFAIWSDFAKQARSQPGLNDQQKTSIDQILADSKKYLSGFLDSNRYEILAWAKSRQRLDGFRQDGKHRADAAREVDALNEQVQTIWNDRNKVAAPWLQKIQNVWDDLEQRTNALLSPKQALVLNRPFSEPNSPQAIIDRFLPWFDASVGCLLILGLFTRLASMAGICLLAGVVATQPFWVSGVANTYYQWIEIGGLVVLLATAAGRFGGLDYFFGGSRKQTESET